MCFFLLAFRMLFSCSSDPVPRRISLRSSRGRIAHTFLASRAPATLLRNSTHTFLARIQSFHVLNDSRRVINAHSSGETLFKQTHTEARVATANNQSVQRTPGCIGAMVVEEKCAQLNQEALRKAGVVNIPVKVGWRVHIC